VRATSGHASHTLARPHDLTKLTAKREEVIDMNADKLSAQQSAHRRTKTLVGVLAVLLLGAMIVLAVLWVRSLTSAAAGESRLLAPLPASTVHPSTAEPTAPSEAPAANAPAAQVADAGSAAAVSGQLPGSCDQLYSSAMVATLTASNLALNPARLDNPEDDVRFGPADQQLRTIIDTNQSLPCIWVTAAGGSGIAVATTVVVVDVAESEQVADRLRSLGFTCVDEREGLRCETQTTSTEGTFGESHFLRDDLWVSTQYGDVPLPEGYTLDIINSLWPLGK
jgi:hypothetical protein